MSAPSRPSSLRRRGLVLALGALTVGGGLLASACSTGEAGGAPSSSGVGQTSAPPVIDAPPVQAPHIAPVVAPPAPALVAAPVPFDRCPASSRACVDVDGKHAWIQREGKVEYGPVPINTGGPGYESPRGTFTVLRKVIDDYSRVFDNSPMPYSVYFTTVGHAFHMADISGTSHGCIRLNSEAAPIFFSTLQAGDPVHLF